MVAGEGRLYESFPLSPSREDSEGACSCHVPSEENKDDCSLVSHHSILCEDLSALTVRFP